MLVLCTELEVSLSAPSLNRLDVQVFKENIGKNEEKQPFLPVTPLLRISTHTKPSAQSPQARKNVRHF